MDLRINVTVVLKKYNLHYRQHKKVSGAVLRAFCIYIFIYSCVPYIYLRTRRCDVVFGAVVSEIRERTMIYDLRNEARKKYALTANDY